MHASPRFWYQERLEKERKQQQQRDREKFDKEEREKRKKEEREEERTRRAKKDVCVRASVCCSLPLINGGVLGPISRSPARRLVWGRTGEGAAVLRFVGCSTPDDPRALCHVSIWW